MKKKKKPKSQISFLFHYEFRLSVSEDVSFSSLVLTHSVSVLTFAASPSSLLNALGKFQQTTTLLTSKTKEGKPPLEYTFDFEVRKDEREKRNSQKKKEKENEKS